LVNSECWSGRNGANPLALAKRWGRRPEARTSELGNSWFVVLGVVLTVLLNALALLVNRTQARTDAGIAERARAWDGRERTWDEAQARRREILRRGERGTRTDGGNPPSGSTAE
jgi:hypothetical protein